MKKHILYLLFFLSVMGLNTSCNYLEVFNPITDKKNSNGIEYFL